MKSGRPVLDSLLCIKNAIELSFPSVENGENNTIYNSKRFCNEGQVKSTDTCSVIIVFSLFSFASHRTYALMSEIDFTVL